jgi:hypothetical protein
MGAAPGTLSYSVGNEHNPADPFGRHELIIEPTGRTRLDHFRLGQHRAWSGRVTPATLARLWSALARACFPNVADRPLPAGATLCTVAVGEGEARSVARLAWQAARETPGYGKAIALLDDIIRQMSGEATEQVATAPAAVVSDVRCES